MEQIQSIKQEEKENETNKQTKNEKKNSENGNYLNKFYDKNQFNRMDLVLWHERHIFTHYCFKQSERQNIGMK